MLFKARTVLAHDDENLVTMLTEHHATKNDSRN